MALLLKRSYYSAPVTQFLLDDPSYVLGELSRYNTFDLTQLQRNTWMEQIAILRDQLVDALDGRLIFEFTIPRVGRRVDNILLYRGIVFLIEFKVGETHYRREALEQVLDYALDLKNFHKASHTATIAPLLVATEAPAADDTVDQYPDGIIKPVRCNRQNLRSKIALVCAKSSCEPIPMGDWESSTYMPTPTIIEAAQALYCGHSVEEISRSDAGAINLSLTARAINEIIEDSKRSNRKSICLVTGVPGAGKTLAGLNIASERHRFDENEHAVFLSGNGPLVDVLQEALARNEVKTSSEPISKAMALKKAASFIQNIHHFRDDVLAVSEAPTEKVVIFDEAQRAWDAEHASEFMRKKRGLNGFSLSEPEFLISVMDRHRDWAVIVCLIGGGQEINVGEAGLPEWFRALRRGHSNWRVYLSENLTDWEYTRGQTLDALLTGLDCVVRPELHLAVSVRSFRSERVSQFVKAVLDAEPEQAALLYRELSVTYPIALTRDLNRARRWVQDRARGTERYGLLASSGARRLKPYGIWVQSKIEARDWFLNGRSDVRSSYYLEDTATEFDIQGLELDWTVVAWDADFRFGSDDWEYWAFKGAAWNQVKSADRRLYAKNAYRVLLTRARQGFIIYLPAGDSQDPTRLPQFYDGTYCYLRALGIPDIDRQ